MRGGTTLYLEFPFWKLPLLIISAFKGVNFQKRLFTPPPLGGILGPFKLAQPFGVGAQEERHPSGEAVAVGRCGTHFRQERRRCYCVAGRSGAAPGDARALCRTGRRGGSWR